MPYYQALVRGIVVQGVYRSTHFCQQLALMQVFEVPLYYIPVSAGAIEYRRLMAAFQRVYAVSVSGVGIYFFYIYFH